MQFCIRGVPRKEDCIRALRLRRGGTGGNKPLLQFRHPVLHPARRMVCRLVLSRWLGTGTILQPRCMLIGDDALSLPPSRVYRPRDHERVNKVESFDAVLFLTLARHGR